MIKTGKLASVLTLVVLFLAGMASAQTDPGVQSGNRGTGAALIRAGERPERLLAFFNDGLASLPRSGDGFQRPSATSAWDRALTPISAVHATHNLRSAVQGLPPIHNSSSPATGSHPATPCPLSLPPMARPLKPGSRSSLITTIGSGRTPTAPNGGVEDLFTVTGRSDAGTCNLAQPNFSRRAGGEQHHLPDSHAGVWRRPDREPG